MIQNVLAWLIIGALIGWLSCKTFGTNRKNPMFQQVIIGMVGALLGGMCRRLIQGEIATFQGVSLLGLLLAIIGSVVVLWLSRWMSRFH